MSNSLARLVCGDPITSSDLNSLLIHQSSVITYLYGLGLSLRSRPSTDQATSLIGPVVARSLLEVCTSTLLARIDPFRLLTLRSSQLANSDIERRSAMAIQWTGDIQPVDKKPDILWSFERAPEKISRALLGHYYEEVFWKPAFLRTVDALQEENTLETIKALKLHPSDKFLLATRGRISTLYTSCSKGVHHEFVIPMTTLYDLPTVRSFVSDARDLVMNLAIVANLSGTVLFPLAVNEIRELIGVIESEEI